jgi:hypothetical protein
MGRGTSVVIFHLSGVLIHSGTMMNERGIGFWPPSAMPILTGAYDHRSDRGNIVPTLRVDQLLVSSPNFIDGLRLRRSKLNSRKPERYQHDALSGPHGHGRPMICM